MAESIQDRAIQTADRLAIELSASEQNGKAKTWRRMSTLMTMMGMQRLTVGMRSSLAEQLHRRGIVTEPDLAEVTRSSTIRLHRPDRGSVHPAGTLQEPGLPPGITAITRWSGGHPSSASTVTPGSLTRRDFVMLEADPMVDSLELGRTLQAALGIEVAQDLLDDLTNPDPAFQATYVDVLKAWHLALAGATTREAEDPDGTVGIAGAGWTECQPVELLIAQQWCVIVWHQPDVMGPDGQLVADQDPVLVGIREWLRQQPSKSHADFLASLLRQLVQSFEPVVAAHRSWLDTWELQLSDVGETDNSETQDSELQSLVVLRRHIQLARRRLHGHERIIASMDREIHRGADDISAALEDSEDWAQDLVGEFRELDRELRTSFDAQQSRQMAVEGAERSGLLLQLEQDRERQAVAYREQQEARRQEMAVREADRQRDDESRRVLERKIALITALLLGPSFIAGLFGANVMIPGQDQVLGTILMLVCMVATAIVLALLLRPGRRSRPAAPQSRLPTASGRPQDGA